MKSVGQVKKCLAKFEELVLAFVKFLQDKGELLAEENILRG
jgi:hypothetical protein